MQRGRKRWVCGSLAVYSFAHALMHVANSNRLLMEEDLLFFRKFGEKVYKVFPVFLRAGLTDPFVLIRVEVWV